MKNFTYLFTISALFIMILVACEDNSNDLVTRHESLSANADYATDIFYRLSDGLTTTTPRGNWDIAFSVSSRESSILTNDGAGVILKDYPGTQDWSTTPDTSQFSTWTSLINSDSTWTIGSFNMDATGHPNYGWGNYDAPSHNIIGVALYVIKTRNGDLKKIWIEKKDASNQSYPFKFADPDGSNEHNDTIFFGGVNKNFIYYSIDDGEVVDREPDTDMWDIVFTKYIDNTISYNVYGVLQNINVLAQESTNTTLSLEAFPSTGYSDKISTIGYDWKTYVGSNTYAVDNERVFFVSDQNDKIFRIQFKTFEGLGTGNFSFDISSRK